MKDIKTLKEYYLPKLQRHDTEHPMGWENNTAQELRFKILTSHVTLEKKSILDMGCGTGDLIKQLHQTTNNFTYLGLDILPEMIISAKKLYPTHKFECRNILEIPLEHKSYDIIYTSGMFNLKLSNNINMIKEFIFEFTKIAKEKIVFNLLDINSPDKEENKYFYTSDKEIIKVLENMDIPKNKIKIIKGYLNNDFTVIISL